MADSEAGERTEEPTSKRLEDARKEGQVVRSRELNMLLSLLGSALAMLWVGPALVTDFKALLTRGLTVDAALIDDSQALTQQLAQVVSAMLLTLTPLFAIVCLLSLLGPIVLGGWSFNGMLLLPKFDRIDPVAGIGRMFSLKALVELVKAIAKVVLVGVIAVLVLQAMVDDVLLLPLGPINAALDNAGSLLLWSLVGFSSALLLVAGLDVPFQLWSHRQRLMMTKQEVKDEMKESEGRPEVKAAIRRRQQEVSQRRMMAKVPQADVVITNPTHYAVALQYDPQKGSAPIVLAKGKDLVAAKIREIAGDSRVPLLSAPPLARALYASTDIDKPIPEDLFVAVAQVLAWIYQLRRAASRHSTPPPPPTRLPVPAAYDRSFTP